MLIVFCYYLISVSVFSVGSVCALSVSDFCADYVILMSVYILCLLMCLSLCIERKKVCVSKLCCLVMNFVSVSL